MTVICATDFSDNSWDAAQAAAAIAARAGDVVVLAYAMPEHLSGVEEPLKELRLDEDAARLSERFGVKVEPRVLRGSAVEQLVTLAEALRPKLVLLSARAVARPDHWLRPSVAEALTQAIPSPLLVVRDGRRILEFASGQRALSVMVGVDLDASSRAAFSWVEKLRELGPCDVTLSQVVWPFADRRRLGLEAGVDPERLEAEAAAVHRRELESWVGALTGPGATHFDVRPGWGRVDTHLTQRAAAASVDLLVVGTRQRRGLSRLAHGSVASGVVHYASCNVACVPARDKQAHTTQIRSVQSVLLPLDLSADSSELVARAYGLPAPGGVVHLLHVLEPERRAEQTQVLQALQRVVPAGAAARGIETRAEVVLAAAPSEAIVQSAARLGVDTICLSFRARSKLSELVLGSQAQRVLQNARCSVLLLGAHDE